MAQHHSRKVALHGSTPWRPSILLRVRRSLPWQRFWFLVGWPCRVSCGEFFDRIRGRHKWAAIIRADLCSYCGNAGTDANPMTREHLVPVSAGGGGMKLNTVGACGACNKERGNRPLLLHLVWVRTGRRVAFDAWLAGKVVPAPLRARPTAVVRPESVAPPLRVSFGDVVRWR